MRDYEIVMHTRETQDEVASNEVASRVGSWRSVPVMHAEGWYQDPFHIHDARRFSDGRPTALVRDGVSETNDPPPVAEYAGPLADLVVDLAVGGSALARSDDPRATPYERSDGIRAAIDSFGYIGGPS